MSYVQGTNVYAWKGRLLGKSCFKPYRLLLYGNGRLLLEKQDSEKLSASGNLCEIFPYIRIGSLDSEEKRDHATAEGLTLAYHTLIIPLESRNGWHEKEFALSFDREIKEWMESFAQVLSFGEQFEEVVRKYHQRKKREYFGSNYGLVQSIRKDETEQDPIRLWATARGSGDDYAEIWSAFLEHCSAKMDGKFVNGRGFSLTRCMASQ